MFSIAITFYNLLYKIHSLCDNCLYDIILIFIATETFRYNGGFMEHVKLQRLCRANKLKLPKHPCMFYVGKQIRRSLHMPWF